MINFVQIRTRGISFISLLLAVVCISLCLGCPTLQEAVDDLQTNGTQNNEAAGSPQPGQSSATTEETNNDDSPLLGDMDGDGVVGQADVDLYVAAYQAAFGLSEGDSGFDPALDIDGDGVITFADLQAFDALVE